MQLYRCLNCTNDKGLPGKEFEAKNPECPVCQADGNLVVQLECIHFDPPSGKPGRGKRHAACNPKLKIGSMGVAGLMMSGEPSAVNCKACQATDAYRIEADLRGVPVIPAHLDKVVETPSSETKG